MARTSFTIQNPESLATDGQRNREAHSWSGKERFSPSRCQRQSGRIAKEAGADRKPFYRHFPTREDLWRRLHSDKGSKSLLRRNGSLLTYRPYLAPVEAFASRDCSLSTTYNKSPRSRSSHRCSCAGRRPEKGCSRKRRTVNWKSIRAPI